MYRTGQGLLIGPSEVPCEGSIGANSGVNTAGSVQTALISQSWQASIGGVAIQLCQYFPDSPQAERERAQGGDCTSTLSTREDLPTGVSGVQAMLSSNPQDGQQPPPSPYVTARLATLSSRGVASPISCTAPVANTGICTAALTYWYVQSLEDTGVGEADLDRAAERIAAFVASTRR